jgi:hypothetical protein
MCQLAQDYCDKHGLTTWFGETYFDNRDGRGVTPVDIYRRSKVVLNHATDVGQAFGTGFGLQCRFFEVGMTKTCFLTNRLHENQDDTDGCWFFGDESEMLRVLGTLISSPHITENSAEELYTCIRGRHMPEHRAAQFVHFMQRNS